MQKGQNARATQNLKEIADGGGESSHGSYGSLTGKIESPECNYFIAWIFRKSEILTEIL